MSNDYFGDKEKEENEGRRRRRSAEPDNKYEEEIKNFMADDTRMAREMISLKREMNRLHFKVKSYQQKNYNLQLIFGIITCLLLVLIAYGVFLVG